MYDKFEVVVLMKIKNSLIWAYDDCERSCQIEISDRVLFWLLIFLRWMSIIILQTTNKCIYYVLEYKEMINMAEQVLVQFRADKALKEEVADIYSQLGMDLPTAFRMFMNKSKQVRGLPFDAVLPPVTKREDFRSAFMSLREEAADVPEMSLEEINAEISAARAERKGV